MRRAAFFFLFLAACASSQSSGPNVELSLAQENLPPDIYYFAGPISVQFQLTITNPTSETIKLRRVDLDSEGDGAYSLHTSGMFDLTIPPNGTVRQAMYAWGRARGGYLNASTPVTMRIAGVFEDATGKTFSKIALQNLLQ